MTTPATEARDEIVTGIDVRRRSGVSDLRLSAIAAIAVAGLTILAALLFDRLNYDVIAGALVLLVIAVGTVPQLQAIAKNDEDDALFKFLVIAFVAKMLFSMIRYAVITIGYGDNADAGVYSVAAAQLSKGYRAGDFSLTPPGLETRPEESQRVAVVLAFFYTFTGDTRYGGTFLFSWICFQGQLLMAAAFKLAVPLGEIRRYRMLLFFMPSMLFWPSSIGKEALMIGAIGLVSYGAAKILATKANITGVAYFVAGVAGLMFIRPHMAMIAVAGLGFASALASIRSMRERGATRAASVRLGALIVLIGLSVLAATQMTSFFNSGTDGVGGVLETTIKQTSTGGSEFTPAAVSNPLLLPAAIVTVFFRPFPWEVHNLSGIIAASEGLLLAGIAFQSRKRLRNLPSQMVSAPYLAYAAVYTMIFVIAFSYIANFGILARQRTQMMPLAFCALAIPAAATGLSEVMRKTGRTRQKASKNKSKAAVGDSAAEAARARADVGHFAKIAADRSGMSTRAEQNGPEPDHNPDGLTPD